MSQVGINVNELISNNTPNNREQSIIDNVRKIVLRYGLNDDSWANAISSQYFLLCLAKQLGLKKSDYKDLINRCLKPLSVTMESTFVLDIENLPVTPEETESILECMKKEDENDPYFTRTKRLCANNIDAYQMYLNFHYGLLVRNASAEKKAVLKKIKMQCLDKLVNEAAVDNSGGWYPYRVPWITGRILVSLKAINFSDYKNRNKLNEIITEAIESLYRRIDPNKPYWRSGVGDWVTKWESTALCLEALYVWDSIDAHKKAVGKIIQYVCGDEQQQEWLASDINFADSKSANKLLADVTLASVIYRITKKHFNEIFIDLNAKLLDFFEKVIREIDEKGVSNPQQYCTLPQILHYVAAAFDTNN